MGFIKLDRKFKDWKWRHKPNMVAVWIYLLLEANYKDNVWNDVSVPAGSLITSIRKISQETGLTIQQTKTCISNLQITNEITIKSTNKYSIITINKWAEYQTGLKKQQTKQQANKLKTNKQITNKLTTLKEYKEDKKEEYIDDIKIKSLKEKWLEAGYQKETIDVAELVIKDNPSETSFAKVMNILTNENIINPLAYIQKLKVKGEL